MNVRNAILKAADHIEKNPNEFDFMAIGFPEPGCKTPGCALGWIGSFLGKRATYGVTLCSEEMLGVSEGGFYNRMRKFDKNWEYEAGACARALRQYADVHCPATQPRHSGIPANIRVIFETRQNDPDQREAVIFSQPGE